jgi:hypothetical protein
MRVRRILLDEHAERVRRNKCPKCKKFFLQKHDVKEAKLLPKAKYKFVDHFWSCSGPDSFNCYFVSSDSGDTLFESSEGVEIIDFSTEIKPQYSGGKIVKRLKNGDRINITPLTFVHG